MNSYRAVALLVLAPLLAPVPVLAKGRVERLAGQLEAVRDADTDERLRLVAALGRSGDDEALAPLLKQFRFRKDKPAVSAAVALALGRLADRGAVGSLLECWDHLESLRLRGELSPAFQRLRSAVLEALGLIGDKKASPVVLAALADEDDAVALAAIEATARLKERKAVDSLMGLAGSDPRFIASVYEALGEIKDSRARPVLLRGAKGDDPSAAAAASYALIRMGDGSGKEALRKLVVEGQGKAALKAAFYLAKLDESEGVDKLLAVLHDQDSAFRASAAAYLAQAGNRKAVGPAAETLERSKDPELRRLCVTVLAGVGGPKAVHALSRASEDEDASVAGAARAGLADLGEGD
ncbi:MAG: HEAT repeat domain-containing protein [Elusimicrobia bacterium]|nr:HEAT repeat domain-containing protein [Elusimicrobiota bacterium]